MVFDVQTALFVGAVVSAIVQWLKNASGTSKFGTQTIVIALAAVAAVSYQLINHYGLVEQFVGVLASASLIYAFIIQHLEDKM